MSHLPDKAFRAVIAATPLVAIDLLVRRDDGACLLGWRSNRPAAGHWFVPGGRIRKGETRAEAFARLTRGELGHALPFADARLLGAFDHLYPDNVFGDPAFGTHYVVLAMVCPLPPHLTLSLSLDPAQHSDHRWMTPEQIHADPSVHPHSRAYFPRHAQDSYEALEN